jgi:hypothetical protein
MKLTFTFSDTPDLTALPKDDIYHSHLELPDESLHLIGWQERVLEVARLVGFFTNANLHLTCKEMNLKNHLIKTVDPKPTAQAIRHIWNVNALYFDLLATYGSNRTKTFDILSPITDGMPGPPRRYVGKRTKLKHVLSKNLMPADYRVNQDSSAQLYQQNIKQLVEQLLILLNANGVYGTWRFVGFNPFWMDATLINRFNRQSKARQKAYREKEKAEAKRKAQEEKLQAKGIALPHNEPQTGAGRRIGARPGVWRGVMMRSQLEIRFATELDERNIRWIYESEALGEASYLVDFFLPDLNTWVEVKGKFEARDRLVLPQVAKFLHTQRQQRLLVFTSSKCIVVKPDGFQEIAHKNFWTELTGN